MATFAIDLISGRVFLFAQDFGSSGTTSGSTYPEVSTYSALPAASSHNGETYLVTQSSGAYVLNRKEAGLYYSNGSTWRRLGDIPSFFNSDNFQIYDGTDNTKGIEFNTANVSGGTFRQLTVQDKNGTIALLTDLNSKVDLTAFIDYTATTAPNTYVAISDFNTYSANTLSLIQGKQDVLTAGEGITIDTGNTISINLPDSLQLKDVSGGTEVNTIEPTEIMWTTEEYSGTSLSFTGGSRIYIQENTTFSVSYNINLENKSGNFKTIGTLIRKNGSVNITPLSSASYSRRVENDASTNSMSPYMIELLNGDYIELIAFRIGSTGSVETVPDGSWIKIEKII